MIDTLANHYRVDLSRSKFNAFYGEADLLGKKILLIKPQTFMNLSGKAVSEFARFYKIPPQRLIVIHDDIDLGWGDIRTKASGGTAGPHGLESIVSDLGTDEFHRIRFGIGRPKDPAIDVTQYVLSPLSPEEKEALPNLFRQGTELLEKMLAGFP